MSSSFYVGDDGREWLEISVDNPGHGTMWIRTLGAVGRWERDLRGAELARCLAEVTAVALEQDRPRDVTALAPEWLDARLAGQMLGSLQRAVVLAAAGTDRHERLYPDSDGYPLAPLCVNCAKGTVFTPGETQSQWCDQYGHTPFGHDNARWDREVERHERDREWWEKMQELRSPAPQGSAASVERGER